jgi:hypothetical protein
MIDKVNQLFQLSSAEVVLHGCLCIFVRSRLPYSDSSNLVYLFIMLKNSVAMTIKTILVLVKEYSQMY